MVAERWIIAALRHHKFFSLAELNEAVAALLEQLNQRRFRKREGSRASLFAEVDRPALQPLPAERYEFAQWKTVRVNIFCGLGSSVASSVQMELRLPRVSAEAT